MVVGLIAIEAGLRATDHAASANPLPTALTRPQFVRAANRACQRANRASKALSKEPKPTSLRLASTRFRNIASVFDHATMTLDRLMPPLREAAAYRRLLRSVAAMDRMLEQGVHDLDTGQYRQFALRWRAEKRRLNTLGRRADSLARKLGLTVCAED